MRSALALACLFSASRAYAQAADDDVVTRDAHFDWDVDTSLLYLDLSFRDLVDDSLQNKLSRGLPTTIVLTATISRAGNKMDRSRPRLKPAR